jgi:hypothetical protein
MSYKSIRDAFFKLDFKNGQLIKFLPITLDKLPECVEFLKEFKLAYPRVAMPKLEIDC